MHKITLTFTDKPDGGADVALEGHKLSNETLTPERKLTDDELEACVNESYAAKLGMLAMSRLVDIMEDMRKG